MAFGPAHIYPSEPAWVVQSGGDFFSRPDKKPLCSLVPTRSPFVLSSRQEAPSFARLGKKPLRSLVSTRSPFVRSSQQEAPSFSRLDKKPLHSLVSTRSPFVLGPIAAVSC
eukprot:365145-Chlamydomonas_euryale.AAC.2